MEQEQLYYIELENGCAVKYARDDDHAMRIANADAVRMESYVVDVHLASGDEIDWVESMHGKVG